MTELEPSPPFVSRRRPLGALADINADPLRFLAEAAELGDVVRFRVGPYRVFLLRHPDAIQHVLVDNSKSYDKRTRGYDALRSLLGNGLLTSEGEMWRRQRRIAQPAFHRQRVAEFARVMVELTQDMLGRWLDVAALGRTIDMTHEMTALTLRIVARTLLSAEVRDHAEEVGRAVTLFSRYADEAVSSVLPLGFPTPLRLRTREATRKLDALIHAMIDERRKDGRERGDLLDMLMHARDGETGERMTDRQLRDEVMTIFLAGHETTANALAWTFYLLSLHPGVERRVRAELDAVLGGRAPEFDDLPKLTTLTAVIKESMRLYPPAWMIERRAAADDVVGGYRIPAGSVVLMSPYITHRHPGLWPNPEGFDPDRFVPEAERARPRYAYFPFGGGPRLCIGQPFAMLEGVLVLATILQRYRLSLVPGHPVVPDPLVTLRPRGGILMRVEAA
jgi:cytochrome P450